MPLNRKKINIPFHMVRNMIIVRTTIDGKGPYNFILDSGVGIIIITDPALADSVGIKSRRTIKLTGLGEGESIEAQILASIHFDINGVEGKGLTAAALKKDMFNLSGYVGMPIHGLIGYDFFSNLAVKFNFADSTLTVGRPGSLKGLRKGYKIPITIEQNKPYMHARVRVDDQHEMDTKLVIDFGAGHPLMLENLIEKDLLPAKHIIGNLGIGLNGPVVGYLSRIKELDIGKYRFKEVITSFPLDDSVRQQMMSVPRDGNLGLNILKRFTLIMDYQQEALYLKPALDFKKPFEHDMSGMEYFAEGQELNAIIVNRIEPGSAADIAGIEPGDRIIAINFKYVSDISIQDIDNIFRSSPDRSLLIDVLRGKKRYRFILTLKRRI